MISYIKKDRIGKSFYPNGKIELFVYYNKEDKYIGPSYYFYPNGNISSIIYRDSSSVLEGTSTHYYKSGFPKRRETYKNGKLEGKRFYYYDMDTASVKAVIFYKDGLKDGSELIFFPNGRINTNSFYKNGKKEGYVKYYDKEGNIIAEEVYKNDTLISY